MRAGSTSSGITGAFLAWLGIATDRMSELFLGVPSALPLRFSSAATQISCRPTEVVAPAKFFSARFGEIKQVKSRQVVDLLLPTELLLERTVRMPVNASRKVEEVATLDLRRKTPFTQEEVHTGLSGIQRGDGEFRVRQFVIKRNDLSVILKRLAKIGLDVRKVFVDAQNEEVLIVDRSSDIAPMAKTWRRVNAVLTVAALGLLGFLWLSPAWQASAEQAELEAELSERRAELVALRSELETRSASTTASERFVQYVLERPKLVELLRELTVALPDEVWLTDVVMRENGLRISGETAGSATDLVLKLSSVTQFQQARLVGPVTRLQDNKERFQISFKLRGRE